MFCFGPTAQPCGSVWLAILLAAIALEALALTTDRVPTLTTVVRRLRDQHPWLPWVLLAFFVWLWCHWFLETH